MKEIILKNKHAWDLRYKLEPPYLKEQPLSHVIDFYHAFREELWNKAILDLGCGNGRHLGFLLDRHHLVYGVDISKTAIKQIKNKITNPIIKKRIFPACATKLPFNNEHFFSILSVNVFHHGNFQTAQESFCEASRCLEHQGLLFLMTRSDTVRRKNVGQRISDRGLTYLRINAVKKPSVRHYFSYSEILELIQESGFKTLCLQDIVQSQSGHQRSFWVGVFRKAN